MNMNKADYSGSKDGHKTVQLMARMGHATEYDRPKVVQGVNAEK